MFSDLCAEVYTLTGRSDRVAETESAVKSATLKAHQSDYFYKDLVEFGLDFGSADFTQSWGYKSNIPRYRSIKWLRKYDNTSGVPGKLLDLVVPENVFDAYKIQKQDIYYVAGSFLQINSSTSEQYYLASCYINPDITSDNYDSWVADDHPYAIIYDAAATVFKTIGKDEEASAYRNLVAEQISILRASNIVATGY